MSSSVGVCILIAQEQVKRRDMWQSRDTSVELWPWITTAWSHSRQTTNRLLRTGADKQLFNSIKTKHFDGW